MEPLHNHMEVTYTKMRRIIFPHEAPSESPMKVRADMGEAVVHVMVSIDHSLILKLLKQI